MLNLPHCVDNLIDYQEISQIVAYDDDSVEISFKDDSNLQLSPCGCNFKYTRPQKSLQPFLARRLNEVTQRCVFATSETRKKVTQAVIIRNQTCKRPCVLSEFLSEMAAEPFRLRKKLHETEWADSCKSEQVKCTPDGKVTVHSTDNFAQLELFPDGHRVRVHFAAALSDKGANSCKNPTKDDSGIRHMYIWQSRIFPAASCPVEWKYPLKLAMMRKYDNQIPSGLNLDCTGSPTSSVPQSLPKKCQRQFSHKWRIVEHRIQQKANPNLYIEPKEFADSSIRFLWCEQGSYWLSAAGTSSRIEVWLPNGSVFKSHPTSDRYFIHLYPKVQIGAGAKSIDCKQYAEIIMSAATMPLDPALKSVALKAIRLTTYKSQHNTSMKDTNPCWQISEPVFIESSRGDDSQSTKVFTLQENVEIPEVGTFSAVADSVLIQFCDRAMLHMTLFPDAAESLTDGSKFSYGQCRTVLEDGQYFVTDDLNCSDSKVGKYIDHARSWVEWLSKPRSERRQNPFYVDTIYDKAKVDLVSQELQKIHKLTGANRDMIGEAKDFQYLELAGNGGIIGGAKVEDRCSTYQDVSKALSHTSKAIGDIDAMLASFKNGTNQDG